MNDILAGMQWVMDQGEHGRKRYVANQLNRLTGEALAAPREQRAELVQQAAQYDRDAALDLDKALGDREERMYKRVVGAARYVRDAARDPNPERVKAAYRDVLPFLSEFGRAEGRTPPPEWSPDMLPMVERIIAMGETGSTGDELKSLRIGANGNYWAIRGGQFVDTGVPAAPDVQIIDAGAAGHYGVNKRTLGATPVRVGADAAVPAQSPPPQAGEPTALPPDVVTAAANRMAKAGVPPEEIDAWVAQATGGAWSDPQPQAAPGPILRKVPQMSPAEQQRIDMERERLSQPPSGYRWGRNGVLEPIPGGPADPNAPKPIPPAQVAKLQAAKAKEMRLLRTAVAGMDDTIRLIDDILRQRGDFGGVTGIGALGAKIPGTDWADLAAKLETLRARSAFGTLQEMRANSPTGGALGSVTERELALLQNAETQLSTAQSPEALERALADYKRKLQEAKRRMTEGVHEHYAEQIPDSSGATERKQRLRFNPATGRIE